MQRLDKELVHRGLVNSRSQAENMIEHGDVKVGGEVVKKPAYIVHADAKIKLNINNQYVSRAALKLKSAAQKLNIDFKGKTILDVGSSTGGFTDYALQKGAIKSIAVDVGTDQLHPSLRANTQIELHEKTDIRNFQSESLNDVDIAVCDVSFISLREILPSVKKMLIKPDAVIVAMVKPQFEAGEAQKNKGVIKNDTVRRKILRNFENWSKRHFIIVDKADSEVSGKKGNTERFYVLKAPSKKG